MSLTRMSQSASLSTMRAVEILSAIILGEGSVPFCAGVLRE